MDLRVLCVLPGGDAVVSTKGLKRVVVKRTRKVLAELLPPDEAELAARTYNELRRDGDAVVLPYRSTPERYQP